MPTTRDGGLKVLDNIVTLVISSISGIISYFLKSTMNRTAKIEESLSDIKENYVSKKEYERDQEKQDEEIMKIRENYTPISKHEKDYDEVRKDIKEMKDAMLRKDDFIREISKLDQRFETNQEKTNELIMRYLGGR